MKKVLSVFALAFLALLLLTTDVASVPDDMDDAAPIVAVDMAGPVDAAADFAAVVPPVVVVPELELEPSSGVSEVFDVPGAEGARSTHDYYAQRTKRIEEVGQKRRPYLVEPQSMRYESELFVRKETKQGRPYLE
jgi:hypothetical protein